MRCVGPRDSSLKIRHLSPGCLQGESGRHYQACELVEQVEFVGSAAGNQEKRRQKKKRVFAKEWKKDGGFSSRKHDGCGYIS